MNTENTFNETTTQTATRPQPQQGMAVKTGVKAGSPYDEFEEEKRTKQYENCRNACDKQCEQQFFPALG